MFQQEHATCNLSDEKTVILQFSHVSENMKTISLFRIRYHGQVLLFILTFAGPGGDPL
jgi:hypothetical protein